MERYSRCKLSVLSGHRMAREIATLIAMPTRPRRTKQNSATRPPEWTPEEKSGDLTESKYPHLALLQAANKIL